MNHYQGTHFDAIMITYKPTRFCKAAGCLYRPTAEDTKAALQNGVVLAPTPRYAVPDTDLCPVHHRQFFQALDEIITRWTDLEHAIYKPSSSEQNDRVQTSGVRDVGALWNPFATVVLQDVTDYVAYLVRTIIRDYVLPAPKARGLVYPHDREGNRLVGPPAPLVDVYTHGLSENTPPRLALSTIYLHHTYWLSAYPSLGPEFLETALDLGTSMLKAIKALPIKRVHTQWRCKAVVEETELGDVLCEGQLVGIVEDAESSRQTRLVCSIDPRHVVQKPASGKWMDIL